MEKVRIQEAAWMRPRLPDTRLLHSRNHQGSLWDCDFSRKGLVVKVSLPDILIFRFGARVKIINRERTCDVAQISHTTFYLHFTDLHDLVKKSGVRFRKCLMLNLKRITSEKLRRHFNSFYWGMSRRTQISTVCIFCIGISLGTTRVPSRHGPLWGKWNPRRQHPVPRAIVTRRFGPPGPPQFWSSG